MKSLIIEDHPVFATALKSILQELVPNITIDTAISAEDALLRLETSPNYEMITLDLHLPGLDGFGFLRALKKREIFSPVVVLSSSSDNAMMAACIEAGAVGFIPKNYHAQTMKRAFQKIIAGEIYLPASYQQLKTETQLNQGNALRLIRSRCESLGISEKVYQVLLGVAAGETNKQIAEKLHISVHTVKAHLTKLFDCLQTDNRMDTVMEAIRLGLIEK